MGGGSSCLASCHLCDDVIRLKINSQNTTVIRYTRRRRHTLQQPPYMPLKSDLNTPGLKGAVMGNGLKKTPEPLPSVAFAHLPRTSPP